MLFCHLVIRFPPLPAPTVKCRMIFWHAMPWNAIAWWYAFAFVQQTLSSPPQGREMVQHILARFTYCNEKFCALFFRFFVSFFFFRFFSVKCWNAIVCVFCTPLRWKPYLSHIPEDSNSRFFLRKRKKKTKKKNEKSTKSTYTIVSAICDCPPEVRRKRSMRNRILPTCSPLRLDCSYAFAVVVCVAAEYARWTNIYQTGFPKQCLPNRIIFLQHFRRVGHPISLPLLHQGLIIPMVQVILEGHR